MTEVTFKITKQWILAGCAIFTVSNDKGEHYTFKIEKSEPTEKYPNPTHFLWLLTGPDNESDYTYVGLVVEHFIRDGIHPLTVKLTAKSKLTQDSKPVKIANFALRVVCGSQELPLGYSIDGEGRCGRCGRTLTHPDGISNDGPRFGFGPTCWNIIQNGE